MSEEGIVICRLQDSAFRADDIRRFMEFSDRDHIPALATYVNIQQYVAKLVTHAEILVAVHGGTIVGLLAFYCNDLVVRRAWISYVSVHCDFRRMGIGERLVRMCLDIAQAADMRLVAVRTAKRNDGATALYGRLGFQTIRECPDRADGSVSVYLELTLDSGRNR